MRILSLLLSLLFAVATLAGPRDALWKQVDKAVADGLPKTAIARLEPIIAGAMKDRAHAEAIKAIVRKITLAAGIEGAKPEEKIVRLQAELAKSPPEMAPLLETILAHWYWQYFQENNWRFLERTATAQPPGDDLATWDLPRILAEIDKHFAKALAAEDKLKAIPVADFDALLEKGTVPDTYRPTLFDFVTHEALTFYAAGEQAGVRAEDAFDLTADSPIFAPLDEFLQWRVAATEERSANVQTIRLYQRLLTFHRGDQDPTALADADLERLAFGYSHAVGEELAQRYKVALKRFVDKWGDHEVSARARFHWAAVLQQENQLVAVRQLAQQAVRAFPRSIGGRQCASLIAQVEAKSARITTERVWNQPPPTIRVQYRNVTKVFFRLIPYVFEERLRTKKQRPEQLDPSDQKAILANKPAYEWSADLPPTEDYRQRTLEAPVPTGLKAGSYFLLASHDARFRGQNNVVSLTDVWVSSLALVTRQRNGEGRAEGFVLDAATGEPLVGAQVRCWYRMANEQYAPGPAARTNEHGLFSLAVDRSDAHLLHARWEDQELATANWYHTRRADLTLRPFTRTVFFTDRALYRPGQTIQFKGLCVDVDQERDSYRTLGNQTLTVVFADTNDKEIARQQHRTNDFGSFSGSFTAPRDRVTGQMTLRVNRGPKGATSVQVEEYKRPKFLVKLEKPKTAARLRAAVTVEGKATAYAGAAINGAKVRYRVVREVRYPPGWSLFCWWQSPLQESQEIAHGTTTTAADGTFRVAFKAKPDFAAPENDEPVFHFTVHADVTDSSGETRSDQQTVAVGYTVLQASLKADEWQTADQPVRIAVRTATLDDEPQRAEGTLRVHRLKPPAAVQRARLEGNYANRFFPSFLPPPPGIAAREPEPDPSNPNAWPLADVVAERGFATDTAGQASAEFALPAGAYRAVLETQDRHGKKVTARWPIEVLEPAAAKCPFKSPSFVRVEKTTVEPGGEFRAVWGTGYDRGRAYVEIEHRRKLLQSYWTTPGRTQAAIKQAVTEALRGGFTLRVTMVRENRAYVTTQQVQVPWTNKRLTVKWERFVSKLQPGQKETWTLSVARSLREREPDSRSEFPTMEMVAALYDASLDAYVPHGWQESLGVFREDASNLSSQFENRIMPLQTLLGQVPVASQGAEFPYRHFPEYIAGQQLTPIDLFCTDGRVNINTMGGGMGGMGGMGAPDAAQPLMAQARTGGQAMDLSGTLSHYLAETQVGEKDDAGERVRQAGPPPDLSKVSARANLNETAFFFPHVLSDKDGEVKLQFTMPEALTEWRFLGFAHDRDLRSGLLQDKAVTVKDLMVQPNPPRFLREGDVLEFTAKVSNQSPTRQTGTVRLTLADARTLKNADAALGNAAPDQDFDVPAGESRSFVWRLKVSDDTGFLTYKTVGSTGRLSDGEEGYLPVLPRRILVSESLPLPIRGAQTKEFDFARLRQSGASDTLRHQSVTVQMASNPAWYAVMALPYLMEFPHECNEQTFNRLYANALARHIVQSDPKIRRVFEQWRATPALDSPLLKNQDLKAVLIEETPWWQQAQSESQSQRNVAVLFDDNRLNDETARALRKLTEQQRPDGAWPWFPGGPANDYITLYIATGFGRLRHLGVDVDVVTAIKAWSRLDAWVAEQYERVLKQGKKDEKHLSPTVALYLYGRSFFLKDKPIDAKHREAVDYFLGQARKYWRTTDCRQSQGHLAIALKRFGDPVTPAMILRSIKEHAVTKDELGMFWRDSESSWWWYHAPIETQALMIEAFDEVASDAAAVDDCQAWLLKQKQTQDWKTSKATADAVYALLFRGRNALAPDQLVEVTLGGQAVKPEQVEAGTGYYEKRFVGPEIKPDLGRITVKKTDPGASWGSVHWQYLEDMSKVTAHEGTPLKLKKRLFTRQFTKTGPVLEPVAGPIKVGDELVVRIELRVDRDMEYVHLKDHRGSGTEPVNVLSGYRFQDGLAYYESTRDTASHFFIDYLPKGAYVFECATRVVHKGRYQTGIAQIQCMYAPEFNSHSESLAVEVK